MTPQEQRTKTKMANLARENRHRNCPVKVQQTGPHWGLYCDNPRCYHKGRWISWINQQQYKSILKKSAK